MIKECQLYPPKLAGADILARAGGSYCGVRPYQTNSIKRTLPIQMGYQNERHSNHTHIPKYQINNQ